MKHFYGYQRSTADAPDGCERVWLDDKTTGRQERDDMIKAVRDGDTVALIAPGDLGHGRELSGLRALIEGKGVTIVVHEPEMIPAPRGRPRLFQPDHQQDKKIRTLYESALEMHHVLDRAREIMGGWPVQRHHLRARYGKRWDRDESAVAAQ